MARRRRARGQDETEPDRTVRQRQGDDENDGADNTVLATRRDAMNRIARSRAAHFAHFSAEVDDAGDTSNPHVGGFDARYLGPWNSAVELADARMEARERRMERLHEASSPTSKGNLGADWAPPRDPSSGPRQPLGARPLTDLAADVVVNNIEDVATLAGLPDYILTTLASRMCARRAMSPHAVSLLTECTPGELCIADCTLLDPGAMTEALDLVVGPRLDMIDLGMCGRGLTDATAKRLAMRGPFPGLQTLRLGAAYALHDDGLLRLLRACPALCTLGLPQAPRLTGSALETWAAEQSPALVELDLADDRGLDASLVLRTLPHLGPIQSLNLTGQELDWEAAWCGAKPAWAGLPLTELVLERCPGINDSVLQGLAATCPGLERVSLDECAGVGDAGLLALAQACRGMRHLRLRRCARLTESALVQVATSCSLRELCVAGVPAAGPALATALTAHCSSTLERLDVSWCRSMDDASLGKLVDACLGLQVLEVWGCTQLTPRFLHGHASNSLKLVGRAEQLRPVLTL